MTAESMLSLEALVIFHGATGHPLSFLLKKGFKHCFVVVLAGEYWIEFNRVAEGLTVRVMAGKGFDLAGYYREHGFKVIETRTRRMETSILNLWKGNIFINNCVGLVKAVLGLSHWFVTPYQLYRYLEKES